MVETKWKCNSPNGSRHVHCVSNANRAPPEFVSFLSNCHSSCRHLTWSSTFKPLEGCHWANGNTLLNNQSTGDTLHPPPLSKSNPICICLILFTNTFTCKCNSSKLNDCEMVGWWQEEMQAGHLLSIEFWFNFYSVFPAISIFCHFGPTPSLLHQPLWLSLWQSLGIKTTVLFQKINK